MAIWIVALGTVCGGAAPCAAAIACRRRGGCGQSTPACRWPCCWRRSRPGKLAFACFADFSDTFNISNVSKRWLALHIDGEKNQNGFRDRHELTTYVPGGKKRIIFLGDSFTAGHGIPRMEDRFTDLIAAQFEREQPGKFVVANLALPAYDALMITQLAQDELLQKHYDMACCVYVYNLNDVDTFDPHTTAALQTIQSSEPSFFLFRDTYLLNWLYFRFVAFRSQGAQSYYENLRQSYESEPWAKVRGLLQGLHQRCVEQGVDFRMVIFPFVHGSRRGLSVPRGPRADCRILQSGEDSRARPGARLPSSTRARAWSSAGSTLIPTSGRMPSRPRRSKTICLPTSSSRRGLKNTREPDEGRSGAGVLSLGRIPDRHGRVAGDSGRALLRRAVGSSETTGPRPGIVPAQPGPVALHAAGGGHRGRAARSPASPTSATRSTSRTFPNAGSRCTSITSGTTRAIATTNRSRSTFPPARSGSFSWATASPSVTASSGWTIASPTASPSGSTRRRPANTSVANLGEPGLETSQIEVDSPRA